MMIFVNGGIVASVLALTALSISTSIPKDPRIFSDFSDFFVNCCNGLSMASK